MFVVFFFVFFFEVSHTLVTWWNAAQNILIKSLVRDDGLFHIHISRLNPQSYSVLPWKGDRKIAISIGWVTTNMIENR